MSDLEDAAQSALEHAGADAVAAQAGADARAARRHAPGKLCGNCGAELQGGFCHVCGQAAHSLRRPVWSLIAETLETLFAFDGRFRRTVPDLMIRPGRVTRAYLDGRRARFLPPFRLYILASLVFFVLLPLVAAGPPSLIAPPGLEGARAEIERAHAAGEIDDADRDEALSALEQAEALWTDAPPGSNEAQDPDGASGEAAPDPPQAAGTVDEAVQTGLQSLFPEQARRDIERAAEQGEPDAVRLSRILENPDRLWAQTRVWIPRLMFVMLPLYALLLALTYLWRRRFVFFDHLVVSLHFHAALFFAMTLGALLAGLIGWGWTTLGLLAYSNMYLYRLHRVVYGRGRFSSAIRTLTLDAVYFVFLVTALSTAFVLGAMSA